MKNDKPEPRVKIFVILAIVATIACVFVFDESHPLEHLEGGEDMVAPDTTWVTNLTTNTHAHMDR